jgi:hypothetical protein
MQSSDRRLNIRKAILSAYPSQPVKCLFDLWRDSFEQPFQARMPHWDEECWFYVMGFAPLGRKEAYGYFDNGVACGFDGKVNGWIRWGGLK